MNISEVERLAREELDQEEFRARVEQRKAQLRAEPKRSIFQRIFPFKIKIERI